jgi:hypothetical protein
LSSLIRFDSMEIGGFVLCDQFCATDGQPSSIIRPA